VFLEVNVDNIINLPIQVSASCVRFQCLLTYVIMPVLRKEGHYEMMAGVCLSVVRSSVHPSVYRVPRLSSRMERPKKPKIGRMDVITRVTREPIYRSKGQRSVKPVKVVQQW